jgi:hypothetical protein
MTRIARIIGVFTATVAALTCSATAAFAIPLPPPGPMTLKTNAAPAAATIVTHTTSGLAIWAVVLIAVASVAVGAVLTQLVRSMRQHSSARGLATA